MALIPFTAYVKVVPSRGRQTSTTVVRRGGKWDYTRDLEKLARSVYQQLSAVSQLNIADPGSGVHELAAQFGSLAEGAAIIPQIGNKPSLVMIQGFYNGAATLASTQPYARKTLIHAGEMVSGYSGGYPWATGGLPSTAVNTEVVTLKGLIDTALGNITDDSDGNPSLFRLVYKGITWGDHGHHFPK